MIGSVPLEGDLDFLAFELLYPFLCNNCYFMYVLGLLVHTHLLTKGRMFEKPQTQTLNSLWLSLLSALNASHLIANSFLIIWEVLSFNCSAVFLLLEEMELSIVSTDVDIYCLSFSQTHLVFLWKSHTYKDAKQFKGNSM